MFSYTLTAVRPGNYNDGVVDAPGYGKKAKNLFSCYSGVATREADGELPHFAWPGGYTILYVTGDGRVVCPKCANLPEFYCNEDLHSKPKFPDEMNHVVAGDVYYEGPTVQCDNCNAEIESSYGDTDGENDESAGRKLKSDITIDMGRLKTKWEELKNGYKFKVWFGGQTEIKTIFIPERNAVVYAAKRGRGDRQYDRPYTVYVYRVGDSTLDRMERGDTSSIVKLKEMAENTAEYVADGRIGFDPDAGRRIKIDYPISYTAPSYGGYIVEDETTGKDLYFQTDYDFPGLASTFGWDGKILPMTKLRAVDIDPSDKTAAEIYSAIQYLDKNEGKKVEDPGYFSGED
jgi:hypothetical protein